MVLFLAVIYCISNMPRSRAQQQDTTFHISKKLSITATHSNFCGFECINFKLKDRECKVVSPKWTAEGHPWVWRARFWGHEPQADSALLAKGFHVAYCDASELFGNQEAINLWNNFYQLLHHAGLAKKVALEGLSRGGVYAYNWAAQNPNKISCVYVDNPVLDLKSWPGGKGNGPGSPSDWELVKKDYNLSSVANELNFRGSPIDKIKQIIAGHYPMLHLLADADEVVPPEENTLPFEKAIKAAGGQITVIHKPGFKHHPHSFPDPKPIVDFIVEAYRLD
ncbi:hypothetical protein SAMN05216436_13018 [bacterium A37T11]|nr:hypothetical protein SAMN05216436_13018 [bacterium A37T11]